LAVDLRDQLQAGLADHYLIGRVLGRGGMATVYLAQDLRHDRPVALKVLHSELAATLGPERFQREIKLAAGLQHPHILTVHDSGETAGQLWYTMPYVAGESLRDRLRRERQLPLDDALQITREIADALGYAHSQGIVHRDIKPDNILLSHGHALVADFGVARALQNAGGEQLTQTGSSVGTPAYMSPEQSMGDSVLDGRSDLYSLGCVLYEMLAGEAPYTGPSAQAIVAKRLLEPVPHVRTLRETVPVEVDQALERALAKTPADRFPTAETFSRAVTGISSNITPRMHPPSELGGRERHRVRPRMVAAGAALAAILLAGMLWKQVYTPTVAVAPDAVAGLTRLAVLPFDNLGDSADAYFADGITDEIRGKLAAIPNLQVIASSSSNEYHHSTKRPGDIGRELGVRYLLLGRVRWDKRTGRAPRVRVDPELMQVSQTDAPTTRWQQPFDAPLTDVFQVQSDIATRVARELQLTLTPSTQDALGQRPTKSLAAYDAYLRGLEYDRAGEDAGADRARAAFQEAIRLDSTFALAWTALAWTYVQTYRRVPDQGDADSLRRATDRALALAPGLADAHARLGEYQTFVRHDNRKALTAYEAGLRLAPNNPLLLDRIGWAEMRLGHWDSALIHFAQATQLDPRSGARLSDLAFANWMVRRYTEAQASAERALALEPGTRGLVQRRVGIALSEGNLMGARQFLHTAPATLDLGPLLADQPVWALDTEQLRTLVGASSSAFGRDKERRSRKLTEAYLQLGDSSRAKAYADSAEAAYRQALERTPDDAGSHAELALILAYLGQHDNAVAEARRASAMLPVNVDALRGYDLRAKLAHIYVLVGDYEKACATLEPLLKLPGPLSPGWLKIDPTFAPLRGNPRFERLVNGT
jgi:serine/threonine-protein kinase